MSNAKYFDFDQWRKERDNQPIVIKAFGKEYEIPSDVPFDLVLKLAHQMKEGVEELDQLEHVEEMATSVFGRDTLNEWREQGIGMMEMEFLIEQVMGMYRGQTQAQAEHKLEQNGGNSPK